MIDIEAVIIFSIMTEAVVTVPSCLFSYGEGNGSSSNSDKRNRTFCKESELVGK